MQLSAGQIGWGLQQGAASCCRAVVCSRVLVGYSSIKVGEGEQQAQQSTAKLGEEEQSDAAGPSRIGSWGSSRVQ